MTLREEVARAIWTAPLNDQPVGYAMRRYPPSFKGVQDELNRQADAAIDIARPIIEREAFERAAQVADNQESESDKAGNPYDNGAGISAYESACYDIANRIRALAEDMK